MLHDDNFIYLKIPKPMGSALIKAIIQSTISCKHDQRSDSERLKMTEYLLLQFANEISNTEKMTNDQLSLINQVFTPITEDSDE
jgi:hypothetical protein